MKRDIKSIMRNSSLAMTSIANLLMAPIFIVVMYFISNFKANADDSLTPIMAQ